MVVEVEQTARVPDRYVHGTLSVQSLHEGSGSLRSPCESGMTSGHPSSDFISSVLEAL